MRMMFPSLTPMVKTLLIINVAVFFIHTPLRIHYMKLAQSDPITAWFSVYPYSLAAKLSVWRLVTYQFLHAGFWHVALNMLGLYFLGPTLEQHWGSRRFLYFYLGCGVAGGLVYIFLTSVHWLPVGPMVGASGAILGLLAACAILFPHFVVFIFLFPVPIRVAAVLIGLGAVAVILTQGNNAGGEAAHFGGMVAGAAYAWSESKGGTLKHKFRQGQWEKRMAAERDLQAEVDRILDKVRQSGLQSLTRRERGILKKATEVEQRRNRS